MRKIELIMLSVILVGGFLVRLYRIDNPIADWHAWRQADTASVSRNFVQHGINVFSPRFDDISNVASGKDNPQGYRFVEFPIYNTIHAVLYQTFGIFTIEMWGRLTAVIASLFSIVFLFLLAKKYSNTFIAFLSAFFFSFLPFSIFYSRVILPDQMMVTATLGSIYFFDRAIEKNFKSTIVFILAILFTASAFLLKPFALFFTLPLLYIAWKKYKFEMFKKWQLWVFLILSVIPLIFWRQWILQHPEGIPASDWLFNGNGIRFRPAFFRWIGYERITKLILGYTGIIFLGAGVLFTLAHLFHKVKNKTLKKIPVDPGFFLSFLVATILYVCIVATGNVQHDYYQIPIIPTISLFSAVGVYVLFVFISQFNKNVANVVCTLLIFLTIFFSWQQVKDYFNINNRALVIAGQKADQILPKDAKVIASLPQPQVGDTSFLYYINRPGWPSFQKSVEDLQQMGATHIVLINPTKEDLEGLGKKYKIIALGKEYLILQIKK